MNKSTVTDAPERELKRQRDFQFGTVRASILIKANDQLKYLEKTFPRLAQQTFRGFEIIFLYSGTSEASTELAKKWGAEIVQIDAEDFSHPRVLNIGARKAQGEFLVMLSADAVPIDEHWLENLLRPFDDPDVAGVYGRHMLREGADLIDRLRVFLRYRSKGRLQKDNKNNLFSNANSAIRKDFWKEHNFAEHLLAMEDYEWSQWAQQEGYCIKYEPTAAVEHVHGDRYTFRQHLARIFWFKLLGSKIDERRPIWIRALQFIFTNWIRSASVNIIRPVIVSPSLAAVALGTALVMPPPEEAPLRPTVNLFEIGSTPEQLPDGEPCDFCGGDTVKTTIKYELPYTNESEPYLARCFVPGYRCVECDADYYDMNASLELLKKVRDILVEAGDEFTLEFIEASLTAGELHLARVS